MLQRLDALELGSLGLSPGEGRRLSAEVPVEPLILGGERYEVVPARVPAQIDVARTAAGHSLRLRLRAELAGPCMRCLERASVGVEVDVREVHQDGGDEQLRSPYATGDELDASAWAHDALALAVPPKIVCREDCQGLCAVCGANLERAGPDHGHEVPPDPRWAKLSELT